MIKDKATATIIKEIRTHLNDNKPVLGAVYLSDLERYLEHKEQSEAKNGD